MFAVRLSNCVKDFLKVGFRYMLEMVEQYEPLFFKAKRAFQ